jgi:hypothetical protein
MNPAPLDGNATAGDLTDVFAFDATTALTTCGSCRHTHPVATLRVYMQAPGIVLRCASCDAVQLRFVRAPERAWLDMRGVALLQIPLASGPLTHDAPAPHISNPRAAPGPLTA